MSNTSTFIRKTVSPLHDGPSSQQVRDLWAYMTKRYGTRVIKKSNARMMRLVARALALMGVMDAESFMRRFTTTIGKRIYVPFEIGVEKKSWDLFDQMVICVHEHQHVEQANKEGFLRFARRYLFSKAARAGYEAEAYRCNMELCFWRTGKVLDPSELAQLLRSYGCRSADIKVAEKSLRISAETVRRGGVVNRASQRAIAWLNKHAPGLRYSEDRG